MMHLSLITLPKNTPEWRFLQPYELHQVLWKGFPGLDRGTTEHRFLHRHQEADAIHSVLVQSSTAPDWSFLADEATGVTASTKRLDPTRYSEGDRFRFLLKANPTVSRKFPDGTTRRIAVGSDRPRIAEKLGTTKDDLPSRDTMLVDWLERQGSSGGFTIEQGENDRILCDVGPNADLIVRKSRSQRSRITLTTVEFRGVLRVTDSSSFRETLHRGIGRGKAFGCGLLSLASIQI